MTPSTEIRLGDRDVRVERPSGRKASVALSLLKAITRAVPDLSSKYGRFVTEYEASHYVDLDRTQARLRFPQRPVFTPEGDLLTDDAGDPVMAPSLVDSMTDEDWERSGQKLRLPRNPGREEIIAALLPDVVDTAEQEVAKLLTLFTLPNSDVKTWRRDGSLPDKLTEAADTLLDDCGIDEIIELAVIVGEVLDASTRAKVEALGDRAGKALRVFGLGRPATPTEETPTTDEIPGTPPTTSTQTSSTDSDGPSDGPPTPPSMPTGASFAESVPA